MEYSENDLKNIIALCEQGDDNKTAQNLERRCKRALAYRDVSIRLTANDKRFLASQYDEDMDEDAKNTLTRILKM